jgi:hypothetical protein
MDNLPAVRRDPPDLLRADGRKKVAVHDWDQHITGALAIGDESNEEWLKFDGEPVEVLSQQ